MFNGVPRRHGPSLMQNDSRGNHWKTRTPHGQISPTLDLRRQESVWDFSRCAVWDDFNEFLKDADQAVDYETRYPKSPASRGIRQWSQTMKIECNSQPPGFFLVQ
jgi:hypothetical protein